ncbi:tetratricopeptide repeat-containing sensor histidine kinase [Ferruginibacter albus]|uniref:tetratricopeptide repeat-containing sensor histidine kinase n=1 Tax=Ferruginibacter albus TaxID=2875540 RepID=UPI001CC3F40D|nr:sensor histidine kinase [Ferruginibacter albus]UAY53410.1 sensor histidine kinase [Ferruginibacter albus]
MKKIAVLIIFSLSVLLCNAQVDSIKLASATHAFNSGDYESALSGFKDCLTQALQNNDQKKAVKIYFNIAKTYDMLGKVVQALENYQLSEKLATEINEQLPKAKALNNIGALYREQKNLAQALLYNNKAEAIALVLKDSLTIADCANNKGIIFEMEKKFDSAINSYKTALTIYRQINDSQHVSIALNNLGVLYKQMGKYNEAIDSYKQALEIAEASEDKYVIAANNVNIGSALNEIKNYPEGLSYNNKGFEIAKEIQALDILTAASLNIANEYAGLKDFSKAYEWQQKYTTYNDSFINIERNKQIAEAETKYQAAQKEKLINEQQFQLTKKNYWLLGSAGAILLICLLGYTNYKRYKLRQETKLQETLITQQQLSTQAVLEAEENERKRIANELHDGVGQMMSAAKMNLSAFESNIQFKDEKQKQVLEKIITLVDDSCKEVRTVSHQMMPNALLKKGLSSAIREFIDKIDNQILKIDLYSEGLNERIDANTEAVLYRVVQECVNNVIKHSGANRLDISLVKDPDGISITVEDNGKGFNTNEYEQNGGMGLKNMRTRIEYLKGTIEFNSEPGKGMLVAIHVPA